MLMWHEFSIKIMLGELKKKSKLFSESQSYNYKRQSFLKLYRKALDKGTVKCKLNSQFPIFKSN